MKRKSEKPGKQLRRLLLAADMHLQQFVGKVAEAEAYVSDEKQERWRNLWPYILVLQAQTEYVSTTLEAMIKEDR